MPTIRRPGAAPADPQAPNASPPEAGAPGEHSLSHLEVPGDTTPTWELEMLVSGAVLVGLFQLPPVVDGVLRSVLPRLERGLAPELTGIAYMYVKGMLYALTASFVLHLASRAYWVALVGLDSVFPQGIRWENTRRGPIEQQAARERVPTLPRLISALDNFCSVLFAVGFLTVFVSLFGLLTVSVAGGVAWGASHLFFGGGHAAAVLGVAILMLMLPLLLLRLERRLGTRLDANGKVAAGLRLLARVSYQGLAQRVFGPIMLTLTTNVRRRLALPLIMLLVLASFAFAARDMRALRSASAVALYPVLPQALTVRANDFRHYADQRTGGEAFAQVPFIQSDVVRDPYVRLFIPYVVQADAAELTACMRAPGTAAGLAPDERATRCLAAIHAVSLNGRALSAADSRFYTDAPSGLQGLLVYIPVEGLAHGRNLVTVRRPQVDEDGRPQRAAADSIPFWL
ncbi:MAG TPA: hypothetical protein VF832_02695 [Longimicrobiales bacterium]